MGLLGGGGSGRHRQNSVLEKRKREREAVDTACPIGNEFARRPKVKILCQHFRVVFDPLQNT